MCPRSRRRLRWCSSEPRSPAPPPPRPACDQRQSPAASLPRRSPKLAFKLRPHQRDGVQFIWEAVMGRRGTLGRGCILADDMGLGKTLQTISVIWTLLRQSPHRRPELSSAIVICPTSLVLNWAAEVRKWLDGRLEPTVVTSDVKRETVERRLRAFQARRHLALLLISYESMLSNAELMLRGEYGLVVCDEAHRLKNSETQVGLPHALPVSEYAPTV